DLRLLTGGHKKPGGPSRIETSVNTTLHIWLLFWTPDVVNNSKLKLTMSYSAEKTEEAGPLKNHDL
ncbi:hypothetical protein LEMLEM_LOCUS11041, partial [Lemmus lemmus]